MAFFSGFNTNALAPAPIRSANPLDTVNEAVRAQNALLGFKAQKAVGQAYQQSINPDGSFDANAFRSRVAGDPNASYAAGQALSDSQGQERAQTGNSDAALAFQQHASNAAADGMGRVISDPTNANVQGYAAFMSRLTPGASKQIQTIANQVMALPSKEQRVEALKAAFTAHMGQEASNRVFGAPTMVDDGETIQSGTQGSPMDGGAFSAASGVQKQVSPDSNAALVPVWTRDPNNPDGGMVQTMTTAGSLRGGGSGEFTGRQRINAAGGSYGGGEAAPSGQSASMPVSGTEPVNSAPSRPVSQMPLASLPVGYEENAKTGLQVKNSLAGQQGELSQNIATLENLNGLLGKLRDQKYRGSTMAQLANNAGKLGLPDQYATLHQEIDKAATQMRKQMVEGGGFPHTNAGLADLEHMSPSAEMTPTSARALTNELLTAAQYQRGRQRAVSGVQDPTQVMQRLADYDQSYDPRFATIQRLGPEEGREYARTHISNPSEYATSVRRMAQAQRDRGYDYGLTPTQIDRILGSKNGR